MGGCLCKTFTVTGGREAKLRCIQPFIFSSPDAENVLMESEMGDYLLYRDYATDRIVLSVRYNSHIRHHRISEQDGLYFLNGQPYPYLDSIVLYHRKHRLDNMKLKKQAHLSARVVRLFAHKITNTNGNTVHALNNENAQPYVYTNGNNSAHNNHNNNNHNNNHDNINNNITHDVLSSTFDSLNPEVGHSHLEADFNDRPATPLKRLSSTSGAPYVISSKLHVAVADDSDNNNISLSSWTQLDPYSPSLNDFRNSIVSSQASLLSKSPTDSNIQIEHF